MVPHCCPKRVQYHRPPPDPCVCRFRITQQHCTPSCATPAQLAVAGAACALHPVSRMPVAQSRNCCAHLSTPFFSERASRTVLTSGDVSPSTEGRALSPTLHQPSGLTRPWQLRVGAGATGPPVDSSILTLCGFCTHCFTYSFPAFVHAAAAHPPPPRTSC